MRKAGSAMTNAHDFTFQDIADGEIALSNYRGQPVLIVNVASQCGFTPQYRELQDLWQAYRDRGLVILGVPSNDFGEQEPGSEAEIKSFCTETYGVEFPLTTKQHVIGDQAHPFYRWIARTLGEDAAPRWNFHKYLIGADGEPAGLWPSEVTPLDSAVIEEVEHHLPR
jgi:glutathione peroxidase